MKKTIAKQQKLVRRHARIRTQVSGTPERPRLAISKSNAHLTAQLIDDTTGTTLAHVTSTAKATTGKTATEKATNLGGKLAEAAKAKGISQVVFDRGGYHYMGIIKAFADSARAGGLAF